MEIDVEIKKEYIYSENAHCQACLSANRNIFQLVGYNELYHRICEIPYEESSVVCLCWECVNVLKKIKLFKKKAIYAQKILNLGLSEEKPISLSSLLVTQTIILDSFQEIKDVKKLLEDTDDDELVDDTQDLKDDDDAFLVDNQEVIDEEISPKDGLVVIEKEELPIDFEVEIKQEVESEQSDDYNDSDYEGEDGRDQTVSETAHLYLNYDKKTVKKYYRYLNPSGIIKVNRRVIAPNDLNTWLDRERNSDYFKNLKRKCKMCLCGLNDYMTRRNHLRKFHKKTKIRIDRCDICKQYFTKHSFERHVREHYISRSCEECGYECYTDANMQDHIKRHSKMVECLECNATFMLPRDFFSHYKDLHSKFECDYCNGIFKKKIFIESHMRRKHNIVNETHCAECNKTFATTNGYKNHVKEKHTVEPTEASYCVQCDRQFNNVALLKKHVKHAIAHVDEWNVKSEDRFCTQCNIQFKHIKQYKLHLKHGDAHCSSKKEKQIVTCLECPKTYANERSMMNHYRFEHCKTSKHWCLECNKPFVNNSTLIDHQKRKHEGFVLPKNKICTICSRGFSTKRILANHVRTHTGERPYACEQCDAKFAQKAALRGHVKHIHLKAKRKKLTN